MEHCLLKEECYEIIGCCMEVHNHLGAGFSEIVYKDALEYELKRNHIPYSREARFQVNYKDIILPHEFFADFVVYDSIILEAKCVSEIVNAHYNQTINYLVVAGMEVGLIVNFKLPKLQYKRVIYTR